MVVNKQFAARHISGLYRYRDEYMPGVAVVRRWSGRGNCHVTIALANGDRYKLGRRFVTPQGDPVYSAVRIQWGNDE